MTIDIEVAFLHQRIAKAKADRETWRALGRRENYLEACSVVDALTLRLDQLLTAERPW